MGDHVFILPGWVVVAMLTMIPALLGCIVGLILDRLKEKKYTALIVDLRAEFLKADTMERHNMRDELVPFRLQSGMHRMNWNQFLAMRHPDLVEQFTVRELPPDPHH